MLVKFSPGKDPNQTRIESAETAAPGTITTKTGDDTTELSAKKFVAQFSSAGRLDELLGHSGVAIRRQIGSATPQIVRAAELVAKFSPDGEWRTLDENGDVRFEQADRRASADRASIVRATDTIKLDGSPVLSDAMSRTTAARVTINQKSGEIHAGGGVVSTYMGDGSGSAVNLGAGPGHISADMLSGSTVVGDVTYAGHARLWQGESVLQATQIEIWRDDKKLQARENVVAVFPQATSPVKPFGEPAAKAAAAPAPAGPTLWTIHAPLLTYWGDAGKAHLEGGVTAESQQGSMQSSTLDVFLARSTARPSASSGPQAASNQSGTRQAPASGAAPGAGAMAGQQLQSALAQGGVTVRQGDRVGTAEQAEYTASDGKFVLSGGHPTIIDAASDATTGHSLTFFVANDTILIDSQEGSRTLTKHRVEK